MTVSQLIEQLQKLQQDLQVVISKDGEGNSYSPLSNITVCKYEATTPWYGEVIDFQESQINNAIVLYPVN